MLDVGRFLQYLSPNNNDEKPFFSWSGSEQGGKLDPTVKSDRFSEAHEPALTYSLDSSFFRHL